MGWNTWKRIYIWGVEMITRVVLTLQVNFKSFHQHRNWWNWIFRLKKNIFPNNHEDLPRKRGTSSWWRHVCWVPAPRSQVEKSATRATRSSLFRTRDFTTMRSWGGVDFPVLWQVNCWVPMYVQCLFCIRLYQKKLNDEKTLGVHILTHPPSNLLNPGN